MLVCGGQNNHLYPNPKHILSSCYISARVHTHDKLCKCMYNNKNLYTFPVRGLGVHHMHVIVQKPVKRVIHVNV
jgi:hypothetical protein